MTPWTPAYQASLSITNSWSLLKLISIKSVMPPNYLILCCPLLLLPSIFPSIRVFSNESTLHMRWSSASASVLPMNTQDWSPLGWTSWISLRSKGLSRVFSNTTIQNINSSVLSFLYRKRTYSLLLFIEREPITSAKRAYWFQVILRKYWFPMLYCSYKLSVLHRNSNKEVSKMHYPDFLTDLAVA